MRVLRSLCVLVGAVWLGPWAPVPAMAAAPDGQADAPMLWRLLDYVAVDYREAVDARGQVLSETEYAEMREFAEVVATRLPGLPASAGLPVLQARATALQTAIEQRAAPEVITRDARELAAALLAAYTVAQVPAAIPQPATAAALYREQCASCHGSGGAGDGPLATGMQPAPIDFTDAARAAERSVFALYQVIGQGIDGTAMPAYAQLPEDRRWALAFYVAGLAGSEEAAQAGARLWQQGIGRVQLGDLQALVMTAPAALAAQIGITDAGAVMAYLRRTPAAAAAVEGPLDLARMRLAQSRAAYVAGDHRLAADRALSAYLDGFEPLEPRLAARDAALLAAIEEAMVELRTRIARAAQVGAVTGQADLVDDLFAQAGHVLVVDSADAVSAFVGALMVLLREGLEALLIVVAMLALLHKAGRTELLPYVHAGWIGALFAGAATWVLATSLVEISGASRELTEGAAALLAAVVLLFVGVWMHGKSQAGAWQRYVAARLTQALSRRSAWALGILVFIVVYREVFETILFYVALWSQGAHLAVSAGAGAAAVLLAAGAWLLLRYAQRLPIGPFFGVSALLLAVLALVLAGKGVAALQEAGALAIDALSIPRMAWLGVYPTAQGLAAQAAVLAVLTGGMLWNRRRARSAVAAEIAGSEVEDQRA